MVGWDTSFPASGADSHCEHAVMQAALIYPHQLFPRHPAVEGSDLCVLVEDPLFFRQYEFHAQKLVLHRASMAHWGQTQAKQGRRVETVASADLHHTGDIVPWLKRQGVTRVQIGRAHV